MESIIIIMREGPPFSSSSLTVSDYKGSFNELVRGRDDFFFV